MRLLANLHDMGNLLEQKHTMRVKEIARRLGFDFCGIAAAVKLDDDARRLEEWLHLGRQGSMSYMENHFDLRTDPRLLIPGAKSVITLMLNYFPEARQNTEAPKIAKYAYGEDYHDIIRSKLKEFLYLIGEEIGAVSGRGFVDSAPVLERAWAQRSGLGWIGKNTNLINKQAGSFYFLATLITDLDLEADLPFATDHCGTCTRCIDTCPTDAILPDGGVDGSRCISYFTIELKSLLIPDEMQGKFQNWAFGCDICQDICPWNRFARPHAHTELSPIPELLNFSTQEWKELSQEQFSKIFRRSPIKRTKFKGLQRNLRFLELEKDQVASELPPHQQRNSSEIEIKNFGS